MHAVSVPLQSRDAEGGTSSRSVLEQVKKMRAYLESNAARQGDSDGVGSW